MDTARFAELLDYRRQVSDLYHWQRQSPLSADETCREFRSRKNQLVQNHPQSALNHTQKSAFSGLAYYPYDSAWRFALPIDYEVEPTTIEVALNTDGLTRLQRFGKIHLPLAKTKVTLSLFWLKGYGGGLFLPFRDTTAKGSTYGGGRYLLDTIKHADLGQVGQKLIVDFNYAYNPSCAYNDQWHCPLAPVENHISVAIPAGEKQFNP